MKKLLFALFVLLVLAFSGCVTQKRCHKKFPPQSAITDTITVTKTIIHRDTIVVFKIKTDTVKQTVEVEVPKGVIINSKPSILKVQYAYSIAQVINNRLTHELIQHDSEIEKVIKDAITEAYDTYTHISHSTVVVKENYLTGFQWFQVWLGRVFALILGVFIFWSVIKILKPFGI